MGVTTTTTLKKTSGVWADEKSIGKRRRPKDSDRSLPHLCDFSYQVIALAPHPLWLANNLSPPCSQQFLCSLDGTQGILLRSPPLSTWQQMICNLVYKKTSVSLFFFCLMQKKKAKPQFLSLFSFSAYSSLFPLFVLFLKKKSLQNNGMHLRHSVNFLFDSSCFIRA